MPTTENSLLIMRGGVQFGPYVYDECRSMLMRSQLLPSDLAWQPGMANWRPIGELFPTAAQPAGFMSASVPVAGHVVRDVDDDESIGQVLGQMGVGCLIWIGVLILALGGGVIFPFLLLLLPIALIGGIIDIFKKIVRLSKRGQRG